MKRLLSILLICTMMFCLAACGKSEGSKDIQLSKDNFDDYFNLSISAHAGGEQVYDPLTLSYKNDSVVINYSVEGATSNYNYNDVTIKLKIKVNCTGVFSNPDDTIQTKFEKEYIIDTNISGKAEECVDILRVGGYGLEEEDISFEYEIVEVNGYLSTP